MSFSIADAASRVRGALWGALVGDALGVPFEFKSAMMIPNEIDMELPGDFVRSHPGAQPGYWSDDGAQTLCLLEALLAEHGQYNEALFASLMVQWFATGRHQSGGRVFDCGLGTASVLRRLQEGLAPGAVFKDGSKKIGSEGNGSLMRNLPVVAVPVLLGLRECRRASLSLALAQSSLTHPNPLPRAACAAHAMLAYRLIEAGTEGSAREHAFAAIAEASSMMETEDQDVVDALRELDRFGRQEMATGGGYVLNSFWSAVNSLEGAADFRHAVTRAIQMGNDTDTTASITGGLSALRFGIDSVPHQWIDRLVVPVESRALLDRCTAGVAR